MKKLIPSLISQMGLESIAFQASTAFLDELALVITDLRKIGKKNIEGHEDIVRLSNVVKHHTGLQVLFLIGDYDASVRIPAVNKNNVLVNNFVRNFISSNDGIKMIQNSDKAVSGSVDLIKGRVTGVFCDVSNEIYMPADMFTSEKYTPEEVAAVIQHEIGHLLTYFEYMAELASTNQALAGLAKGLDGSGDIKERETILVALKAKKGLSKLDVESLARCTNDKAVEVAVITNIMQESRSQLERNIYDLSSWEYLADQYVARQGGSRHLATALSKIYKSYGNISFRSSIGYVAIEALKLALVFIVPGLAFILMAVDGQGDGTYDVPGARLKRVRNQVIENLKDKKLDKDDIMRLEDDIKAIDACLEQINDRRQFVGVIWDLLWPSANKDRSFTNLQKELEAIATSDLFRQSALLRTMA